MFARFRGFVTLMSIRLVVSTLAVLCFLVASAVARAWPWLLDKLLQVVMGEDVHTKAKHVADNYTPTCWAENSVNQAAKDVKEAESSAQQDIRDDPALAGAALNILVGFMTTYMVSGGVSMNYAFFVVAFQMMVQLLLVSITLRHTLHLFKPMIDKVVGKIRSVVSNIWQFCHSHPLEHERHDLQHCASQILVPQQCAFISVAAGFITLT